MANIVLKSEEANVALDAAVAYSPAEQKSWAHTHTQDNCYTLVANAYPRVMTTKVVLSSRPCINAARPLVTSCIIDML